MYFLYHFIFIIVTIFILIRTIFYGLYEVNTENNKYGGIAIICVSIFIFLFTNIIVFFR